MTANLVLVLVMTVNIALMLVVTANMAITSRRTMLASITNITARLTAITSILHNKNQNHVNNSNKHIRTILTIIKRSWHVSKVMSIRTILTAIASRRNHINNHNQHQHQICCANWLAEEWGSTVRWLSCLLYTEHVISKARNYRYHYRYDWFWCFLYCYGSAGKVIEYKLNGDIVFLLMSKEQTANIPDGQPKKPKKRQHNNNKQRPTECQRAQW